MRDGANYQQQRESEGLLVFIVQMQVSELKVDSKNKLTRWKGLLEKGDTKPSTWHVSSFRRLINRRITTPQARTDPLRAAGPGHVFLQLFQSRFPK